MDKHARSPVAKHRAARGGTIRRALKWLIGLSVSLMMGVLSLAFIWLLIRNPSLEQKVAATVQSENPRAAIDGEATRMTKVINSYRYYRYGFMALALIALVAILVTRSGLIDGIAAGVFVLMATQLIVDHYSEQRSVGYLYSLTSHLPTEMVRWA